MISLKKLQDNNKDQDLLSMLKIQNLKQKNWNKKLISKIIKSIWKIIKKEKTIKGAAQKIFKIKIII